jgi:hypothetical protein
MLGEQLRRFHAPSFQHMNQLEGIHNAFAPIVVVRNDERCGALRPTARIRSAQGSSSASG